MSKTLQGLILRCIGGFYYVEAADAVYTCRARGAFRKQGITPVAGDRVVITAQESGEGTLQEILERRNVLVRPPVANVDLLVLVASICEPVTNTLILDKMLAVAEYKGITPLVVVNKSDLQDPTPLMEVYQRAGLECFAVSTQDLPSLEPLRRRLSGCVSVFTGNSGVGKSSIINGLDPSLVLETGEISHKLGRGRHTTRTASLYRLADGYLVDTPGFSSLDLEMLESIDKESLPDCFREFEPYLGQCRFTGCAHYREPGCAVRQAVEAGVISASRYDSYVSMYESVKDKKEWEKA
ncbi:MAG: ribosome small subunit-dependent GTPase A [Ruminococcaceae bacterium]|nr:ribosome small subunit-dependent GTPase A [Oscillospiraceae bacterium]